MHDATINWLLEDKNPAVKYRTLTEILGKSADVSEAKEWIYNKLPDKWFETKGLWYIYYVTAIAECGLSKNDVSAEYLYPAFNGINNFEYGCADFMLLRAIVKLGYHDHEAIKRGDGQVCGRYGNSALQF